jgi:hypothetical protein
VVSGVVGIQNLSKFLAEQLIKPTKDKNMNNETTADGWIPITGKMPKVGRKVIVCGHYSNGNRWMAFARWQPAKTIDAETWDEYPDDWEDEDGDTITNPHDLWLEESVELETTGFLENVTHWMEKPKMPNDDEWLLENYLPIFQSNQSK